MKVIVCNYRYFITGGPERYMFSLFDIMEKKGHQMIPFSVAYTKNEDTKYQKYFVPPPGNPSQVFYKELNLSFAKKIKLAKNVVYSTEAKKKLERMIEDEKPDIINTLQIHTVLSYSLIDAAKKYGLPVVSRLSNYQLLCPAEHFLRKDQICEECTENLYRAVKHKCVQNSISPSFLRTFSLWFHRFRKTFEKVDCFIVPSNFLRMKMIEGGFEAEKIAHVPTFINVHDFSPCYESNGYIAYFGRIAVEKGVLDLVKAYSQIHTQIKLLIIGNYNNPEGQRVMTSLKDYDIQNVEFLGYQPLPKIKDILKNAMFTICPSIWYENTPNSIYESFALGKPVLGSRIGSIPEQISEGKTGILFESGNIDDFSEKMTFLLKNKSLLVKMGKQAREFVENRNDPESHYNQLISIYNRLLKEKTK